MKTIANEDNNKYLGVISPYKEIPLCNSCKKLMITSGQTAGYKENDNDKPLFCLSCNEWYHSGCANKNWWSIKCPFCKTALKSTYTYCNKCSLPVDVDSKKRWPRFACEYCSTPTDLAVVESIGGREITILVLMGAFFSTAFVFTFLYELPIAIKIVSGVIAVPLSLPWIMHVFANTLAEIMPASMNVTSPGADPIYLKASEVKVFRKQALFYRLRKIYMHYASKTILITGFVFSALVFIYIVTSFVKTN